MRKLTQGKVAWIIDAVERGRLPIHRIAKRAGVTPRWVRELWRRSGCGKVVPELKASGRPRKGITEEERAFLLECERQFRLHPRALERKIMQVHGRRVPHNRIWAVFKEAGLVTDVPSLHRKRSWVRFERRHSNSLWQMDYSVLRPGRWLLVILDDASRLIAGYAETDSPTAELAWETFLKAGERYGFPRQVLTDHGTQFTKEQYDAEGYFDGKLRGLRKERGVHVQHIHSRVKHPQTGGKVERVFGTIKSKLRAEWPDGTKQFRDLDEVMQWYNDVKPHESLDFEHAETPAQAFVRKLRPQERKAYLKRHGHTEGRQ
jgi:putative transposase